jgi:hypothetical protein
MAFSELFLARPLEKLFFEKKVDSFRKLMQEVSLLDLDSGIRTFGDYGGKRRQLVFVTRSPHDSYTLMVYEKTGAGKVTSAGERLLVREFKSKDKLAEFMRDLVSNPVRAFVY